ncbi:MAG: hypothetical protein GY793_10295 [Proteobacteria bacterium]|nr:hypothetical protein [Pseudomonadota bacterium]
MSKIRFTTIKRLPFSCGDTESNVVFVCPNIHRYKGIVSMDIYGGDGSEEKLIVSMESKFLSVWKDIDLDTIQRRKFGPVVVPSTLGIKMVDVQLEPKDFLKITLIEKTKKVVNGYIQIKWLTEEV